MSAVSIIARAEQAGIVLSLGAAGKLKCLGAAPLVELMRAELMTHKVAILEVLLNRARVDQTGTLALFCTVCGPIYANGKPACAAGHAYGMPIVSSCEWCRAGTRPTSRPKVACSTCKHFERTDSNKISGPGDCAAGAVPAGMAHRVATLICGSWLPNRTSQQKRGAK